MKHWNWIGVVVVGATFLLAVLVYVGIPFPVLRRWGGHMVDPEFLIMLYRLGLLAIIVIGLAKLKLVVNWWLKNKEKEFQSWLKGKDNQLKKEYEQRDIWLIEIEKQFSDILDAHLKHADRHIEKYRKSYEERLKKLEEVSFPKKQIVDSEHQGQ